MYKFKGTVNKVEQLNEFQVARWTALIEGLNIIADKAKESGISFREMDINPSDLREYVDKASDRIFTTITRQNQDHKIQTLKSRLVSLMVFPEQSTTMCSGLSA